MLIWCIWAIDFSLRPYLVKTIIDKIAYAEPHIVVDLLFWPIVFYIGISLLIVVVFRVYDFVWLNLDAKIKKHVGLKIMDKMLDHSCSLYQEHLAGSLANKINDVINGITSILRICIDRFFSQILAILLVMYTLYHVKPIFVIMFISWAVVFIVVSLKFATVAKKLSCDAANARSKLVGSIVDVISNVLNIQLFTSKKKEMSYLSNAYGKVFKAAQKRDIFFMKMSFFQSSSFVIFQTGCLYMLIVGVQNHTITPGDFALILTLNSGVINCLWSLTHAAQEFTANLGNLEQGLELVLAPIKVQDKPNAKRLIISRGEIVFDKVQFQYNGITYLFNNQSIKILAGTKVGLVGYSGSGKSSFVNLILRLFDVSSGSILIDGQDISGVTLQSLRKAISIISQDVSLFHRSIKENIIYGKPYVTQKELVNAAKCAYAHDFILNLPHGYDSLVGEHGVKLSTGQRQRILIARTILKNAPILILDEATCHLDSITENLIYNALIQIMKDKTTIIIAHRLSTLLNMDRILVFNKGQIVEDGTHQELLAKKGIYKLLCDTQINGF